MNVRQEIEKYAAPEDRPALRWLLTKYNLTSQWRFVAECWWKREPGASHSHRLWIPTPEGRLIFEQWGDSK